MKIPHGIPDFGVLRTQGYTYIDKTSFLPRIEDLGPRYLLFLRPRRIGKSLFLSLLAHYYDIAKAERFDDLFRGLWIHEHPTPERSSHLILHFDFSEMGLGPGVESVQQGFFQVVKNAVHKFVVAYMDRVPHLGWLLERIDGFPTAEALTGRLMAIIAAASPHKIFVLIDEYDNFANRLLSDGSHDMYSSVVERTGFVRTFYAVLKAGAGSGAVSRMFITGVAPLLLDDLSSGFNISTNISSSHHFNALAGFTRADVSGLIDALLAAHPSLARGPELADREGLLDLLEQYYDGYRFSPDHTERVFNSDMVLYFLHELEDRGKYPAEMLDLNVRTDYRRLLHIGAHTGAASGERRALIERILGDAGIQSNLVRQFGARSLSFQENFISFLYYIGMLTLGTVPPGEPQPTYGHRLVIPNRVIRRLQWEHLGELLRDEVPISFATDVIEPALQSMAAEGDIAPFLDLFHDRVINALGVKDLRRLDEKSIKLMMLAFISQSRQFHPLSEKEFAQGYCDLFLGVPPIHPTATYAWLLELKYLRAGAKAQDIERAFARAFEQVARYASDERLVPLLTQGRSLKAGALVFVGAKQALFRPWPPEEGREGGAEKPARGTVHGRRAAKLRRPAAKRGK